jgi:hypothetical protein
MKYAVIIKVAVVFLYLSSLHTVSTQRLATPFSGKLPSEIYLASLSPENGSSLAITTTERNLLFLGGPSTGDDEEGYDNGPMGSAPVRDSLWALVFCCLAYGVYCRKNV